MMEAFKLFDENFGGSFLSPFRSSVMLFCSMTHLFVIIHFDNAWW